MCLRWSVFLFCLLLGGCSSFGIRTSTTVNYITADGSARVIVYVEGNIPGSGVDSTVPVTNPRVDINAVVNGGEAANAD